MGSDATAKARRDRQNQGEVRSRQRSGRAVRGGLPSCPSTTTNGAPIQKTGDLYAARAMHASIPKYKIPREGLRPDIAFHVINDELMLDGNARQNLATFCQTWFDDEIHKLMDLSIDKNMIDKDEYRQRRKSKTAACTSSPIFGMRRRQATRSAARRRARARRRCSGASR